MIVPGIKITLQPVQIEGIHWLQEREKENAPFTRGGLLCDDMGIGKTAQLLSLIALANINSPTLIIGSKQIVEEWKRQLGHFDADVAFPNGWNYIDSSLHHTKSSLGKLINATLVIASWSSVRIAYKNYWLLLNRYIENEYKLLTSKSTQLAFLHSLQITSREIEQCKCHLNKKLNLNSPYLNRLKQEVRGHAGLFLHTWQRIICDEGHTFKNPDTDIASSIMCLRTEHPWYVSGTPVHNSSLDMWIPMQFIGVYDEKYCTSDINSWKQLTTEYDNGYPSAIEFYSKLIGTVMLRREKVSRTIIETVRLNFETPEEKELYDSIFLAGQRIYCDTTGESRNCSLKEYCIRLRQICVDPRILCMANEENRKLRTLQQMSSKTKLIEDRITTLKSNCLQLSPNIKPFESLITKFTALGIVSTKINYILTSIEKIPANEKIVIFAEWKDVIDLLYYSIEECFPSRGILKLDGRIKDSKERSALIHRFQTQSTEQIILVSMKTGAEGITLTAGKHVIFAQLPYNPKTIDQATDRLDRFGQQSEHVNVTYVIIKDTIEERIVEILLSKLDASNSYIAQYGKTKKLQSKLTFSNIFENKSTCPKNSTVKWQTSRKRAIRPTDPLNIPSHIKRTRYLLSS